MYGVGAAVWLCVGSAGARPVRGMSAWDVAVRDRAGFEAEIAGTHTPAEYTRVLDEFRAIYHANPADMHAAVAVEAVAELLAEQGREFGDAGSLKAAVGQYEFLRKEYPGSAAAFGAKERIAGLKRERVGVGVPNHPTPPSKERSAETPAHDDAVMNGARKMDGLGEGKAETDGVVVGASPILSVPERGGDAVAAPVEAATVKAGRSGRLASVTGIRHWSTATYTRVAIDLGDEVTFEAARVPHPDRIYFDLHGARLAQELVGKSFDVTDDGFLKRIRAAQFSGDMTRVVLDVSDVSEYSAFLLPNPYRLIIDVHGGKKSAGAAQDVAAVKAPVDEVAEAPVAPAAVVKASAAANSSGLPATAPTVLAANEGAPVGTGGAGKESGRASLDTPPYPVKPERMGHPDASIAKSVPGPRTGTVAKSTVARPVPNTVAVKAPETATEVAAVSAAPGKVEATREASTKPIAATVAGSGVKDVSLGSAARRGKTSSPANDSAPAKAAAKTADGETSLVRALGLKIGRIVIDAGHGGHDSGTLGVDGIEEKDVVLDVALRLGKLLHERLGAEIIYTRSDDTFIPLETRTAIANKAQADLFLSIHANSSEDATARGVETYYLNFTSDPTALDVAARENAVSGSSIHQLSDLVKKITLKDKIAESREFAVDVEGSLYGGLRRGNEGLKDRGVKKAPFVVLIGANMPSILAEISFVTNPKDAEELRRPEYRERVAESLFAGVAKYESGLGGVKAPAPIVRAAGE